MIKGMVHGISGPVPVSTFSSVTLEWTDLFWLPITVIYRQSNPVRPSENRSKSGGRRMLFVESTKQVLDGIRDIFSCTPLVK